MQNTFNATNKTFISTYLTLSIMKVKKRKFKYTTIQWYTDYMRNKHAFSSKHVVDF